MCDYMWTGRVRQFLVRWCLAWRFDVGWSRVRHSLRGCGKMRHGIGERVRDRVRLMTGGERSWCPGLDRAWPASTRHGLDSARTRPFSKIKPGCCFIWGELCVGVERIA